MGNPTKDWNAGCVDPTQTQPAPSPLQFYSILIPEGTTAVLSKVWTCTPVSLTFCSLLYKESIFVKGFQFCVCPSFMWRELELCHSNKWHLNEPVSYCFTFARISNLITSAKKFKKTKTNKPKPKKTQLKKMGVVNPMCFAFNSQIKVILSWWLQL